MNIKEANEHLKQLHQRVYELENQLQLQALHVEELQKTNIELKRKSKGIIKEKDSQISELTQCLHKSEEHVQKLLEAAEERDVMVEKLETKARLFYEVVEHKAVLARMLEILEELSQGQEQEESSPPSDTSSRSEESSEGTNLPNGTDVDSHTADR